MPLSVADFLGRLSREALPQVSLVHGDLVLAEPAGRRIAEALAGALGLAVEAIEAHRHPSSLSPLLADLRTFSLFASAKVMVAIDSAVFADRAAAAELIAGAAEVLPLAGGGGALSARERQAAGRLLQGLRLFDVDPWAGSPEHAIGALPAAAFEAGRGSKRGGKGAKKEPAEGIRQGLSELLEAARREEIRGIGDSDVTDLAELLQAGLPAGHALVLVESAVALDHPLVRTLAARGALLDVGRLEAERGGWQGIERLVEELARQTGVEIAPDAAAELARRTLRQEGGERGRPSGGVDADSSSRFAGEYRKLAALAASQGTKGRIGRRLVEESVEDRGEEDVWQILDAIAAGRGGEALGRLNRLLAGAEDTGATRLSFFSLLASYCRQLVAVRGMMRHARVPAGESSYPRFKDRHAPLLQGEAPHGAKNPLAGLHPYRLHRAYLAASRLPEPFLARLLSDVLETELQLKGESAEGDAALAHLVVRLSSAGRAA
jgi:DNA polymerase III delta subunit